MQNKQPFLRQTLQNYWIDVQYRSMEKPVPRSGHCMVSYDDMYLYVFGGLTQQKSLNDLWLYNISEQKWSQVKPKNVFLPVSRASASMVCFDKFKKIYLFGGTDFNIRNMCTNDLLIFDIDQSIWKVFKLQSTKPCERFGHSILKKNFSFFVFGGTRVVKKQEKNQTKYVNEFFNDLWEFNILIKLWKKIQTKGKEPQARYRHQSFLLKDDICILGGSSEQFRYGNLHILNMQTYTWTQVNVMTKNNLFKGRFGHFCFVFQNRIIVYGGKQSSVLCSDAIMLELGQSKSWNRRKIRGNYPTQRQFFAGVYLKGKIIIFGGRKNEIRVNDMSIWNLRIEKQQDFSLSENFYEYLKQQKYCDFKITDPNELSPIKFHPKYLLDYRIKLSKLLQKNKDNIFNLLLYDYCYLNSFPKLKKIINNNSYEELFRYFSEVPQLHQIFKELLLLILQDSHTEINYENIYFACESLLKNNSITHQQIFTDYIELLSTRQKIKTFKKQTNSNNSLLQYWNKINSFTTKFKDQFQKNKKQTIKDLQNLYNSYQFQKNSNLMQQHSSDIKIVDQNSTYQYQLHKFVLCARSHYFEGFLDQSISEIILDENVTSLKKNTIQFVLKYIYLGASIFKMVNLQQQDIKEILALSGYWMLKDKNILINMQLELAKKITNENVYEIMKMASKINAEILEYKAIMYCIYHKLLTMENMTKLDPFLINKIVLIQQNLIQSSSLLI